MVADDVWGPAMAQALSVTSGQSRLLVTTRRPEVARGSGFTIHLGSLPSQEAIDFLTKAAGEPPPEELAGELVELSGGRWRWR